MPFNTEPKRWYESKTVWTNFILILAAIVQIEYGWVIDPEIQVLILAGINFLLRIITGRPIEWARKVLEKK